MATWVQNPTWASLRAGISPTNPIFCILIIADFWNFDFIMIKFFFAWQPFSLNLFLSDSEFWNPVAWWEDKERSWSGWAWLKISFFRDPCQKFSLALREAHGRFERLRKVHRELSTTWASILPPLICTENTKLCFFWESESSWIYWTQSTEEEKKTSHVFCSSSTSWY